MPCNDFGGQEPGTAEEIKTFCTENYSVTFPLMAKVHVKGPEQHPLYAALTSKDAAIPGPAGDIDWNFAKFVIGRDGQPVRRFANKVQPDAPDWLKPWRPPWPSSKMNGGQGLGRTVFSFYRKVMR